MRSIKTYLILALLMAFFAGFATGRLPLVGPADEPGRERFSPASRLCNELGLDGEQREQVLAIWKEAMKKVPPPPMEKFREIDRTRDEAIAALMTDDQKRQVEQINADFERKMEEANRPATEAYRLADEQTRALLTPEQQAKFDKIVSERSKRFPFRRGGSQKSR